MNAAEIIATLGMQPHPEGGHYRETFRDPLQVDGRTAGTAIYYLLQAGERSHWHRVDATEIWHWHAGAQLALSISPSSDKPAAIHILGMNLDEGARPQCVVPCQQWQSAQSLGEWTLVSCTVAPGFEFAGFEMAPSGWAPGPADADGPR